MRKAVATDMAALNKHGDEIVSNCLPENRSIRFTLLMLRQQNGQAFRLSVLSYALCKRDSNESVKKTTQCVVFSGCPKAFAKHKNC